MKASSSRIASFIRNLADNRRGVSGVLSVIALPVLVGVAGYAIDIGHALQVQRALQASTDAAALAGAHYINSATASPIAAATTYGAESGSRNAVKGATVTMVSGYPKLECLTSVGQDCNGPNSANAIQVKQRAVIQTWFSQVIGIDTFTVTVSSTATAGGSQALPLDIMVVMDTTASMNDPDPNCPISGATRLTCALAGLRTLLQLLNPSDQVGLMTFPGVTNSTQAAYDYACNSTTPTTVAYDDSPDYQIVGLANDFIVSGSPPTLSDSSDLVLAAQGGPTGCTQGLKAAGGYGTYYADVIAAAQTALMSDGRANVQKVIILLSDGDANAKPQNMPPDKASNQCHEAITAAANATAAGTWVYSLAYGASTDASPGSCSTDAPAISACSTMRQIASKAAFFYSDQSGGTGSCTSAANSVSELMGIFGAVGKSFQKPRLVLDSTN
jgi:Flp pilus assembly protein TadG